MCDDIRVPYTLRRSHSLTHRCNGGSKEHPAHLRVRRPPRRTRSYRGTGVCDLRCGCCVPQVTPSHGLSGQLSDARSQSATLMLRGPKVPQQTRTFTTGGITSFDSPRRNLCPFASNRGHKLVLFDTRLVIVSHPSLSGVLPNRIMYIRIPEPTAVSPPINRDTAPCQRHFVFAPLSEPNFLSESVVLRTHSVTLSESTVCHTSVARPVLRALPRLLFSVTSVGCSASGQDT